MIYLAIAIGATLGWFSYDLAKLAFMAFRKRRTRRAWERDPHTGLYIR